jgi:hypothetical protein
MFEMQKNWHGLSVMSDFLLSAGLFNSNRLLERYERHAENFQDCPHLTAMIILLTSQSGDATSQTC